MTFVTFMTFMAFLTDFADQGVILPVVLAVGLVLALYGRWRAALLWLAVIGATFAVVVALKFGFIGCGSVFDRYALRSPSGHTAAAAVVAGGLAGLFTPRRAIVLTVATLAAAVIGMSRIALNMHSPPEVVLGAAIGILGAAVLPYVLPTVSSKPPVAALAIAVLVAVLLHGRRLPAEPVIERAAYAAMRFIPACRVDVGSEP
jgi:membrane-associated phospholipid phosphatase